MVKKVVLVILDGFGYSKNRVGNAIKEAYMPTLRMLERQYPSCLLQASGLAVGLPYGETGNSEVGHLNIGAGRIVEQYLPRINRAIADGSFYNLEYLHGAFIHARARSGIVHMAGLLTSGSVHASFSHIEALLEVASNYKDVPLFLHCFMDGKDSGLEEGAELITRLENECQKYGVGVVASVVGRKIAMDRDNNWQATEKAYLLLTQGKADLAVDIKLYLKKSYEEGKNDQIIEPAILNNINFTGIKEGDALIFWNFREDAIRQLASAFFAQGFNKFPIKAFNDMFGVIMTPYDDGLRANILFPLPVIDNALAEVLSLSGVAQYHITETEKFAHVTYFFDGLRNQPWPDENWELVASDRDFVGMPEMQSEVIAQKLITEIKSKKYGFLVANFPNGDILAHTGNYEATIKGLEAIDRNLLNIYDAVIADDAVLIVTSDHGNAESLVYMGSGEKETRHDDSPVPFYLVSKQFKNKTGEDWRLPEVADGVLADVSPTILEIMGIKKPQQMSGESLLRYLV